MHFRTSLALPGFLVACTSALACASKGDGGTDGSTTDGSATDGAEAGSTGGGTSGGTSSGGTSTGTTTSGGTSAGTTTSGGTSTGTTTSGGTSSSSSDDGGSTTSDDGGTGDTGGENGWELVWSDEFEGDAIDLTKWSFVVDCWGGGNGEQQCYTDRDVNGWVESGVLHLKAQREDFTGPAQPMDQGGGGEATLPYTSARLRSRDKGDWTYGRLEIRAQMPAGQGTWPAIWMLPTASTYGGWAASGEIDIMESVNLKAESDAPDSGSGMPENRVHGTIHYGGGWPNNVHSGTYTRLAGDANPADDFHVYAIEWEEGEIRWYLDDVHYATQRDWWYRSEGADPVADTPAPFDQDFHLLINVAVGGAWAGQVNEGGIDEGAFPQEMLVEYVRVYECSVDPVTGKGCATLGSDPELVPGVPPP